MLDIGNGNISISIVNEKVELNCALNTDGVVICERYEFPEFETDMLRQLLNDLAAHKELKQLSLEE